jgi:hypothetical protein
MPVIMLQIANAPGNKVTFEVKFPGGSWLSMGDPVPRFVNCPRAGFEVHDLYHFTLLSESGWSAVLGILMGGDRGGVFGGPDALAEEAMILDRFLPEPNSAAKNAALLNGAVRAEHIAAALDRGDAVKALVLANLDAGAPTVLPIKVPAAFIEKAVNWMNAAADAAA